MTKALKGPKWGALKSLSPEIGRDLISVVKFLGRRERLQLGASAAALLGVGYAAALGATAWADGAGAPVLQMGLLGSAGLLSGAIFLKSRRDKKAQAERVAGEQASFEALAQNAPDMIITCGSDGTPSYVSPAVKDMLGFTPEDLMLSGQMGLIYRADRKAVEIALSRIANFGEDATLEYRMRNRDGDFIWVEMHGRPISDTVIDQNPMSKAAAPLGQMREQDTDDAREILAVIRDITATKSRELDLVRARDLSEAESQSKLNFLAGVSHELRTPLSAINGFSEVMMREMFGPMGNEKYVEYADLIHTSGHHLLDLINDLLDVSKIEAGKYELDYESVFFPLIIESALRLVKMQAQKAGVRLEVNLPHDLPRIEADPRAARQILLNLLSNAIKFTQPGGTVRLSMFMENGRQVLEVDDTGVGIPADDLKRLGNPYEQANNQDSSLEGLAANDRAKAGTGLGLALVRSLAELHNGAFHISSEVGEGTLVQVAFPVRAASDQPIDMPLPGILEATEIEEATDRPDFDGLIARIEEFSAGLEDAA